MPLSTRIDRVRGCLLGMAIGDALGAPLGRARGATDPGALPAGDGLRRWRSGLEEEAVPLEAAGPVLRRHPAGPGALRRPAGSAAGSTRPAWRRLYLELATPEGGYAGAHRGVGRSFRQVLADLKRGTSRRTGPARPRRASARRCASPRLALYFADDPEAMHDAVMAASLMTHRDVRSLAGAMAVAHAVRRLVAGPGATPASCSGSPPTSPRPRTGSRWRPPTRVASLEAHGRSLSQAIANAEPLLDIPRERALAALAEEANRHGAEPVLASGRRWASRRPASPPASTSC